MTNDQYSYPCSTFAIKHGVRKGREWIASTAFAGRRTEARIGFEKSRDSLELLEESTGYTAARLHLVVAEGDSKIAFCLAVQRPSHRSSALRRARTSSRGTSIDVPASISASRRAATASQAESRAASASRLATTRSSSRTRSAVDRRRTSSSRASRAMTIACTHDSLREEP